MKLYEYEEVSTFIHGYEKKRVKVSLVTDSLLTPLPVELDFLTFFLIISDNTQISEGVRRANTVLNHKRLIIGFGNNEYCFELV